MTRVINKQVQADPSVTNAQRADAVDAHANVRPTGVKSIQIVGAFDNAPVTDSDFELLGSTTRMNATLNFSISDAGKSIGYRFRYLNTKDQPGPWTTTLAATILK